VQLQSAHSPLVALTDQSHHRAEFPLRQQLQIHVVQLLTWGHQPASNPLPLDAEVAEQLSATADGHKPQRIGVEYCIAEFAGEALAIRQAKKGLQLSVFQQQLFCSVQRPFEHDQIVL
jgi:hypothetical protein